MKIGVFDSGLGGLSILKAIQAELPAYSYIYYGDTANLPYGDKPEALIIELTRKAIEELFKRDAALVVVACNTASAETLRKLQETMLVDEFKDRRILGVIVPTIEELLVTPQTRAFLIGTRRTVESQKYERELIKRGGTRIQLSSVATPELVPLIESNQIAVALAHLEELLAPRIGEIDTLILGCTHYTVLKEGLRKRFSNLTVISQDEFIPRKLSLYLEIHPEIERSLDRDSACEYIFTGNSIDDVLIARE